MIVTPRDAVIADYAVRSYARIRNLDFTLLVYSNYLLPDQKAYYFPRWQRLDFVEIAANPQHDDDLASIRGRIDSDRLEGPFEYCDPIWDRELRKIDSPLVATVDADFELRHGGFVGHMVGRLLADPELV